MHYLVVEWSFHYSYTLKFISPEINVIKGAIPFKDKEGFDREMYINRDCGVYFHFKNKVAPISKGMLGTFKVKNPRLCARGYTDCKELTISNSF